MNEEALQQLYSLARGEGYSKSFEDFKVLMGSNEDAINNMYSVAQNEGYQKDINEFKTLVGFGGVETIELETEVQEEVPVKKKEDTVSPSGLSSLGLPSVTDIIEEKAAGPQETVEVDAEVEAPQAPPSSDGEIKQSFLDRVVEKGQRSIDKKEEYQTYNPAVAPKSATADFTQYKDYLPQGVETIPNAKQVLEGDYNPVVPFDQAEYEKNPEAYQIIYNNKVKDYEEYLKGEQGYIKGYNGKYYSSDKFSPETILEKELATLRSRDGNLMDRGDEAIVDRISERLGKFGFDVKYDQSIINIPEGRLGASATITSQHTGKDVTIGLDTLSLGSDKKELDKLNAFVLKNFDEDKVEVKDLLKGLSAQDKAAMGAETERKYETLSVGRTISDAEDMVVGIDKQIEAANKMLEEAQAMPDYEEAVSTSVGSGMMMGTSLRGINKKKALKLKQAKAQLEYLKQQKKDADSLLKSAEEGKQAQATKFASKVLGEQMMTESERLENEAKKLSYTDKVIGDVKSRLEATAEKAKTITTEQERDELIAQSEDDVKTFNELARIATEQQNNYRLDAENLRKDVGRKVILDAQVGGLTGSVVRSLASGAGSTIEGFYELLIGDLTPNIINMFYNEDDEGYITDAERKEFKKDSIQDDLVGYVSDKFGITDEAMEAYRKGLSLQDMIKNVKEGKEALEGSNWFTEGIYGMIESLPAISTSLIAPGASIASFAAMGINGLNKEMESNPMFANVSENEKLLLTLPYGVVIGVLENYGFRNALNNSGFVSKLLLKSLNKFKGSTKRTFREVVSDELENKIAKGLSLTALSGLAEFETGAAQQAVEGYMKEAYDVAKGMDYFKQSIDFLDGKYITKDFVNEVFKAGLSEMVGGFAMGAIPAISQARKNNTIAEIPIGAFMAYEIAMLDPAIRKAQVVKINSQVEQGLKTKEEAAKEVQDYDITIGQLRAIPQEFDLKSRQQILALESQKKILEDKIEGKSVFTTREEQRQIKVIEERIEEVSANAQKGEAKKSNQDILTEEFVKSATKEEVAPKVAVEEEVTTEEAPVAEDVEEEVTQEQLAEVRALEEEAPVVEEEVTTEEAPVTEEEQEAKAKARAEKLAELDRNLREATTEKAPVAETQEVVEDGKVPEVTKEQQDRYNNKEMSDEEIKDILVGLNTKVQMRADGKTEEKITAFERKIKNENETLFREVLGMRAAPKTETKTETAKKVAPKKEAPKKEAPKKKAPVKEEVATEEDNIFVYEMDRNTTATGRGRWEADFEIIDNRPNEQGVKNVQDTDAKWIVLNKITGIQLDAESKKDAQGIIKNAPAESGIFEGQEVDLDDLSPKDQKRFKKLRDKQKIYEKRKKIGEKFLKSISEEKTPKKEAPKKETGVDAKLRAIAVKMDKAAKEKVRSKVTKAEMELIKKNTKRFKEINDEVKMPTTTADGIRSAIKMVEDSFKEKETKIKEQIKTIDRRVTDRMTKDKDRQKKKDELSKARKEKNAKVKELKAKLTDMGAKFRLSDDVVSETEEGFITEDEIVEGMKKLGSVEKGFKIPSGIKEGDVDPIAQSKSTKKITDAQAKKLGFKSVSDMLKNIQEFNDIPMIVAMSDVLASGVAKDSMGNDMKVDGGLLYNVLGSNTELAWAGVNETGANTQYNEALDLYRANKELFDRLWKEGKLPQNHVPMVVLRMGNTAINSNEAMFRYLAPLIKSFPKQNQDEAFSVLMESIEGKKNVSQKNKSGRDTVKSAKQLEEIINKNNITDVGSLFDFIVKDAKKRAKGDNENTIPLPTRALLFDLVVSPVGVKKPSKGVAKALIKDTQSEGKEFLADKILSDIGETSMMESESGDAVAIMGVDVINGGVRKANHNNYGFGPKGRLIALIKNPMNGLNIFPEWRAKAVRVFKKDAKGEMPSLEKVLRQVGGAFFIDKAFRGARVQTEQSDIDVISGKMRFAFPGVSVSQTQQEFDEALKQEGIRTAESNGNTILGLTKDGKIFLNPSRKSLSTPIHEFGHIWIDFLRSESSKTKGTKLLKKGLELVEGTKALESAIKKYGDNELAREEALVELMGTKGETIANAAKRAKFIEWFNAFFKYIKEKLTRFKDVKVKDIKDISLEDFVDIGLAELFSGQAVDKDADVKFKPEEAATSAKARMQMEDKGVDLKGAIEKVIARARAKEISDNVIIAYLMEDKGFDRKKALATIKRVNRKNLRSAIKSLFASVKDITNISEQEAELVKELLKYDRATTRADKAIQKKAKEELLAQVRVMARVSKGKISAAQLSAVLSRLTRVNLSRQSSIDGFVDYMRKVFSDADYAQKIVGLKSKLVDAKNNIKTKIGVGQDGLSYELTALFSIDPSIIPDDVFTKYEKLVTSFGARQTELSLPEASELKQDIADINDSLNTQNSLVGELTERFNSFEDKKTTEDGKVEYAATVKRMLKDKVITEEEAKLMTKFSKDINPREEKEGKSEEQKEKEMEEQKKELIQEVKDSEINAQAIDDKMSKQVAESLSEMIKTEAINELSNPQLKNLIKVIDNINNGHLTHNAKLMIEALESSDDSDIGTDGIKNANPLKVGKELAKLKTLTRKGKDKNTFYKLLERNPLYYLDTVLGDATSKKIFNSVMEKPAEAFSKYNTELNKAYDEIDKAERLIIKHFKSNGNDVTFSKFKQMAYMVQEEFESNPNSNQVNPASEVLDATIEKLEETNQERNAEALLKIKEDFSTEGQIDLDKLMKSFSTAEKKMLKAIKQFNSSQTDMAVFTAAVIRGQAIDPLNNYVHQQVLSEGVDNIAAGSAIEDLSKMTDMFALNTKPSTKAKNLIDRTKGAKAINFDVVSATKRAAKMTLMDYHLTSSLRTANKTLNKMSDKLDKKGQQRQIFKGIRDGYNQAIRDALQVNFASDFSLAAKGINVLTKNAYRGILAHSGRVGVEFLSNLSFAINNPRDFSQGVRHLDVALGSMGAEVMNNVDSKQTTRVYPSGLSGNYVDPNLITNNKGVVANEMKNPVVNKLNQAMALGPRRLTKGVGVVADTMLSGPDKVMMRPIWFGSFAREFAAQVKNRKDLIMETAKMRKEGATDKQIKEYIDKETEVDFKKIAENDAEYMSRYKKEIREAKRKADDNSVLMGSTNNPLMGILKNTKRNSDTYIAAAYKNFNTFMQNFLLFEFNAFRRGWYTAMQGKTKEQKASGLLLMGAVSLRMMMYNVLMSYGFSLFFGGDDDKEEDSLETRVSRSFWNTFTGLLLGRDFGAAVKALIGVGVESVNKIHGEDLGIREGEYNPYKNSVQFNPLQMLIGKEKDEETGEESWTIMSSKPKEVLAYRPVDVLSDIAPNFLGPLSPLAKTLAFGFNKVLLEEPKTTEEGKRKDELEEYRLLLEIGGHSGFVPFYKDFRNELLDEMYKDVGKKKKSSGKSSRPKRPSRGKRKSRPKR
jgi:hypothetical protein